MNSNVQGHIKKITGCLDAKHKLAAYLTQNSNKIVCQHKIEN